jgi:hypothetical protein
MNTISDAQHLLISIVASPKERKSSEQRLFERTSNITKLKIYRSS